MVTYLVLPFKFCLLLLFLPAVLYASEQKAPDYVSSSACSSCHEEQFRNWSDSHHSWAWREPIPENVLGDFDDASFEHNGFTYRFLQEGKQYFVVADSQSGKAERYLVHSVVGVTPLQQYLVHTGKGRLQALDVAWDTEKGRWYHLYPDIDTSAGNGLHWSGTYKNWNSRCAECHVTGYEKRYDPRKDTYNSVQAEIGVGCEACHGPGEAHMSWAKQPDKFNASDWQGIDKLGFVPTHKVGDAASEINLCAVCHSRREPLGADSPPEGADFSDHYRLSLLRESLYFPDGQIKDEVYVYGSFLQSRMYARGVRCTHCHDAHNYGLKMKGNALCTQCHNVKGNSAFPSLLKAEYDSSGHHFHAENSKAAECTSCHMPERNYMIVDGRRDHGFRLPRPGLAEKIGSPDVCTACHQDKSSQWAARVIQTRFPESGQKSRHFSEVFASIGVSALNRSVNDLLKLAKDIDLPAIVRATALERCSGLPHALTADDIKVLAEDRSNLVRMASIGLVRNLPAGQKTSLLIPLLGDVARSVRIEAAKAMLDISPKEIPASNRQVLDASMKEFQNSMLAKSDFPEGQMVLGGVALTLKRFQVASTAFERAVSMDPQLVEGWMILIRIKLALGEISAARQFLVQAIQNNPDSYEIEQLAGSMGMQLKRNN